MAAASRGHGSVGKARLRPPNQDHPLIVRTALLDQWVVADPDVTLIRGPAGFGKTCLALQIVDRQQHDGADVAWLTLGATDNDADTLVRHFAEALAGHLPAMPDRAITEVLETHGDRAAHYAASLVADATESASSPIVMVLDDSHIITEVATCTILADLINACSPRVRFVLTSRGRPVIPLSALRLTGRLHEITENDLRVSTEDAADILGLSSYRTEAREALISYANGWIVGLRMMALTLQAGTGASELAESLDAGNATDLGRYLAENVASTLEEPLLTFMQEISICDHVTVDLATELTASPRAAELLDEAVERSLFVTRPADEPESFHIHQAFRDFLAARLRSHDAGRADELHLRAAHWYIRHGYHDVALTVTLRVSADAAGQMLEQNAMRFIEDSRMAALIRLAGKLPAEQLDKRWRLLLAVAWANALLQRTAVAQICLDHARAALPLSEIGAAEALAEMDVAQACIDGYNDRTDRAPSLVSTALTGAFRPFVTAVAANANSYALLHRGDLSKAREQQSRAHRFHIRNDGPFAAVYGRSIAGLAALEQLDLPAADRLFQEATILAAERSGTTSHALQLARGLHGELMMEIGQHSTAVRLLEDALVLGAEGCLVEVMRASFGTLGRAYHLAGQTDDALTLLDEGMAHAARLRLPRLEAELLLEVMHIAVAQGDNAAIRAADRSLQLLADDTTVVCDHTLVQIPATVGRALAATKFGRCAEAATMLRQCLLVGSALSPRRALLVKVHLALALASGSHIGAAEQLFDSVISHAAAAGAVGTLRTAGTGATDLLIRRRDRLHDTAFGSAKAEKAFLDALLRPHKPTPRSTPPRRGIILQPTPTATLYRQNPDSPLNQRELEVVTCLENGLSNKEIASKLFISVNTVKWHLKNINSKLGTTSRLGVTAMFRQNAHHTAGQ